MKQNKLMKYLPFLCLIIICSISTVYAASEAECNGIFGDPNKKGTIAELLSDILNIIRWGGPILVILLGTIDIFTAVISSNEDGMKKAQKRFVSRVILGVCLFLIPTIINFIIDVASSALGYDACSFKW